MLKSLLSYAIAIAAAIYLPIAANPNLGPPASILCCLLVVLYIHQNEGTRVRARREDRSKNQKCVHCGHEVRATTDRPESGESPPVGLLEINHEAKYKAIALR